jgi:hypothetical protein
MSEAFDFDDFQNPINGEDPALGPDFTEAAAADAQSYAEFFDETKSSDHKVAVRTLDINVRKAFEHWQNHKFKDSTVIAAGGVALILTIKKGLHVTKKRK